MMIFYVSSIFHHNDKNEPNVDPKLLLLLYESYFVPEPFHRIYNKNNLINLLISYLEYYRYKTYLVHCLTTSGCLPK